jgi:hypothetical protein
MEDVARVILVIDDDDNVRRSVPLVLHLAGWASIRPWTLRRDSG